MLTIIWSDKAKEDYEQNINYLVSDWSVKDAVEFVDNVNTILQNLPDFPEMFPDTGYKAVRKGVVCKQISILYVIRPDSIELLRFWNNHQNPGQQQL